MRNRLLSIAQAEKDSGAALAASDVIELLSEIARARDPNVARAVADMLKAASRGQKLEIDIRNLGISPRLLTRLLEAVGAGA